MGITLTDNRPLKSGCLTPERLGRRRITSHDHRAALDHGERFAQTFDPRPDRCSRAEVEDHHMVLRVVDDFPTANFNSMRRRWLRRHWKTDSCSHSPYPFIKRKT